MSNFPRPCIIALRLERPWETKQPSNPPRLAVNATMAMKTHIATWRACRILALAVSCMSEITSLTVFSLSEARLSKAPWGTTTTMSQRVYSSNFMERVPTSQQSVSEVFVGASLSQ